MNKNIRGLIAGIGIVCLIGTSVFLSGWKKDNSFEGKVDIGGYNLYVDYKDNKESDLTIIFETGYGDSHEKWDVVRDELALKYDTVSYDRAGLGQSDESPDRRISKNQVKELHELLKKSGIKGPYVFVAHSVGGINTRMFAKEYPGEISGVVFVDSSHENQEEVLLDYLPEEALEGYMGQFTQEGNYDDVLKSLEDAKLTRESLKNIPIIVMAADDHGGLGEKFEAEWIKLQKDIASLSDESELIEVKDSQHYIHEGNENVVIDAIEKMVDMVQNK